MGGNHPGSIAVFVVCEVADALPCIVPDDLGGLVGDESAAPEHAQRNINVLTGLKPGTSSQPRMKATMCERHCAFNEHVVALTKGLKDGELVAGGVRLRSEL
jgi:hypothetical protein